MIMIEVVLVDSYWLCSTHRTSNGSWCMSIKGRMSFTVHSPFLLKIRSVDNTDHNTAKKWMKIKIYEFIEYEHFYVGEKWNPTEIFEKI